MQGEAEVKVFGALRAREAERAGGRHVIFCGDGDAVVMALMLPPAVALTVDLGGNGILQVDALRAHWVTQRMRRADVPPWPPASTGAAAEAGGLQPSGPPRRKRPRVAGREPKARVYPLEQVEGVQRVCR